MSEDPEPTDEAAAEDAAVAAETDCAGEETGTEAGEAAGMDAAS